MESACLSSSAGPLHRQVFCKSTADDMRSSIRFRCISSSGAVYRQKHSRMAECLCVRAKLRVASAFHPLPASLHEARCRRRRRELVFGVRVLSRPRMAYRPARSRFCVFSCLDTGGEGNGNGESSGLFAASTCESSRDGRLVTTKKSVMDREGELASLQDVPHETEARQRPGAEDALQDMNSLSRHGHATWFQERFIETVRPVVRVLNGTHFKKALSVKSQKHAWEGDEDSLSLIQVLNGSLPPEYHRRKIGKALRKIEADFFLLASHVGRFLLVMMATGAVLATGFQLANGNPELETIMWYSWLAGIIVGSMIGAEKVMEKRARSGPRNVVITGSTRGLGKALAREFLLLGDRVVIASRSCEAVAETVEELKLETQAKLHELSSMESMVEGESTLKMQVACDESRVIGMACDVSKVTDVRALAGFATAEFGSIDIWVNNAGVNKGFRPLVQFSDDDIAQIVSANLIGSLLCTREALRVMKSQPKRGHIFNMDGAGSGGSSTPLTAVYGATKCGLRQLHSSLLKECKRSRVGVHTASPGMVLTDLLLSGASLQNKKMFNIMCELPETVARSLVPRMREIRGTGKAINFLTPPRILLALITAWLRRGRWFDEEGRAVYAAEADRLRNWAEDRTSVWFSAGMDHFSESTLISVFSITVICAFIMLSTTANTGLPGT